MSGSSVRYLGFSVRADGRCYEFAVSGATAVEAERVFLLSIATSNFGPGRLKFQEGPEITLRKLRALLAAGSPEVVDTSQAPLPLSHLLSDSDITEYTASGPAKSKAWTEEQREAARQRFKNRLAAPH